MGTGYFSTNSAPISDESGNRIVDWLSRIPPFASLPESERKALSPAIYPEAIPEGTILFLQGTSRVENVYLVKTGILELQDRQPIETTGTNGSKESELFAPQCEGFLLDLAHQSRILSEGDIFGATSMLLNAGLADKSVKARRDTVLWVVPGHVFLDLCNRHPVVTEFFTGTFTRKMMDASYASMIVSRQARSFLQDIAPFSFLPEAEIARIASELSIVFHPQNHVIFSQGSSEIAYLVLIQKGAAERYFEEGNHLILHDRMGEGSLYGGISMLLNNAIAIRSLKATENTYCYVWPKERFLETCNRFEHFRAFFTDTFGKWMLDRSYAAIVAQMIHAGETTAPSHLDQPIEGIYQANIVHCPMDMPIRTVAERMGHHRCSSILVTDRQGKFIGIVTESDLRKKVIAAGLDIQEPVAAIMSSPLRGISPKVPIFDAMMVMMQQGVKHLAITDARDTVVGILTNRDILAARGHSPLNLMREIQASGSLDEMARLHRQLPAVIQHLIRCGAKAENLTRMITTVSDMILVKILDMAIETIGPPPCRFAFMVLGSEGRKEQTLKTDQDNAILYEDPPESSGETVRSYFLALGETVCNWLNQAGYEFCQGGVMAKNPLWCQPVSVWKRYFSNWTHQAEAEDLLQASIFFDFRGGYGDMALVRDLRRYLMETLLGWAGFFRHMTENALYFRPPVGFFRNFVVQSKGEYRDSLDIKSAMMPIIDIIRIYALKYGVAETNTPERMLQLVHRKKLAWEAYKEMEHAYGFLMQLRFSRQVHGLLIDRTEANNFVNPKELTQIERTMLKEIFIRIERMQQHVRFEFIGS
ncbi:DUF294 nucleotidyltransferase-like domain-containing protein [Desulfatirhabdium butyrativorans]|uniref:DUF294 nucleotidyltransferase-like domain-containing protein n=1 Tax=Desulfatirhabdium butyrativorans TaxID=340467 RepID=UPI0003FC3DDF|nr:DUF294 nucleotidyltransferase-like domain-containing protein [Desulfatirhabdium butyrativorans]